MPKKEKQITNFSSLIRPEQRSLGLPYQATIVSSRDSFLFTFCRPIYKTKLAHRPEMMGPCKPSHALLASRTHGTTGPPSSSGPVCLTTHNNGVKSVNGPNLLRQLLLRTTFKEIKHAWSCGMRDPPILCIFRKVRSPLTFGCLRFVRTTGAA